MTILVTRPSPAGDELVSRLRLLGKAAWALPLIEFAPGRDLATLPTLLARLNQHDLLFALSHHAVEYAQSALTERGMRWTTMPEYYAIGRKTALALRKVCTRAVVWPAAHASSEILIQLPALQRVKGKQALILRGNGGRELLAETLTRRGAEVKFVECYQRCAKIYQSAIEGQRWRNRQISTLVVTSGEMLKQLWQLFQPIDRQEWLLQCHLIVASTRLATLARELGWRDIQPADGADNDALLRALQ